MMMIYTDEVKKFIILFTQLLLVRLFKFSQTYTWSVDKDTPVLDKNNRYLFISNHQSRIDPFVIINAMKFHDALATLPIKFITARSIYYGPLRPVLFIMGCFPTYIRQKPIIEYAAGLIHSGYSLFIFPEGRRTMQVDSSPKDGVLQINAMLDKERLSYILIHIEWTKPGWRRHAHISFKKVQDISSYTPQSLMDEIYNL